MPRVIHFEIDADNPQRAVDFYQKVFGWQISNWEGEPYWLVKTGEEPEPGIDGAIRPRTLGGTTTNTISVPSVDEYVAAVVKAGGSVIEPKMPIPMMGYLAYCKDTEGNVFGIIEMDPTAR